MKISMKRVLGDMVQSEAHMRPIELCALRSFRGQKMADIDAMTKKLVDRKLIEPSVEPDFHRLTHKGEMVGTGQKCPCRECSPSQYR